MTQVWISAAGLGLASIIGSLLGFLIKEMPKKWNNIIMGFCTGLMLAASSLGLIQPAAELAGIHKWWLILSGVIVGMLFLKFLDVFTPHLHKISGLDHEDHVNNAAIDKVLLFVIAIAIHKFPEGIATGVGFNADNASDAWAVTLGLALQSIPEGMVVIAPLLLAGVSRIRTFMLSLIIVAIEVAGVWTGYGLGSLSEVMLPVMLSFAGGAMLYVVCDEMIPDVHHNDIGTRKLSSYALIIGFMVLLFMQMAFE